MNNNKNNNIKYDDNNNENKLTRTLLQLYYDYEYCWKIVLLNWKVLLSSFDSVCKGFQRRKANFVKIPIQIVKFHVWTGWYHLHSEAKK